MSDLKNMTDEELHTYADDLRMQKDAIYLKLHEAVAEENHRAELNQAESQASVPAQVAQPDGIDSQEKVQS